MTITFSKATKQQLKARIAFAAPTGAGKTYTSLEMAGEFGGRTVLIDTEHGSGALYADQFDYDYFRFDPPYDPSRLVEVLRAAEDEGYTTMIVDSLSHFWEGEGGTLDIADAAGQRANGNSFAGWKVATPALRHLVDTMLALDAHLIVTMRSKMEYVLQEQESRSGRTVVVPTKVGMAPVMRNGIEYEFTLVGDLDLEHRITISKSRCAALADQVIQPGRAREMARTFLSWLESGEAMVSRDQVLKITEALNAIPDEDRRKQAKGLFMEYYDVPDRLLASQFDEALAFAQELAVPVEEPEQPPADEAPTLMEQMEAATEGEED